MTRSVPPATVTTFVQSHGNQYELNSKKSEGYRNLCRYYSSKQLDIYLTI